MKMIKTTFSGAALLISLSALGQSIPINPINEQTVARYRYESLKSSYAEIPVGLSIEDLDLRERDYLKPLKHHSIQCLGVNNNLEPFFQIENLEITKLEEWMSPAHLSLITPTKSITYDSLGAVVSEIDHNSAELATMQGRINENHTNGWRPIMMFFPSKHDDFIQEAIDNGAHFEIFPDQSFKLSGAGHEMIIDPNDRSIVATYTYEGRRYETRHEYMLYAPYGYVPKLEEVRETRLDLPNPITQVSITTFHNHVIEDFGNKVEKYTDAAHIEIFPNPVEGEYEIVLKGIPEAVVSQVQVRDYMGNIVHTHLNPSVNRDLLVLDASTYPAGPLIILVQTQQGLYSETLTKI